MKLQAIVLYLVLTPLAIFSQSTIEVGFSPDGTAEQLVENTIDSAQKYIYIAAYEYTSIEVTNKLIDAQKRGIDVRIVADYKMNIGNKKTPLYKLQQAGILVRLISKYDIQHSKYAIIDGSTVQTGSFNYTYSAATRNSENVIVITNVPEIAAEYKSNWIQLWNAADKSLSASSNDIPVAPEGPNPLPRLSKSQIGKSIVEGAAIIANTLTIKGASSSEADNKDE